MLLKKWKLDFFSLTFFLRILEPPGCLYACFIFLFRASFIGLAASYTALCQNVTHYRGSPLSRLLLKPSINHQSIDHFRLPRLNPHLRLVLIKAEPLSCVSTRKASTRLFAAFFL
jgi:hypothetical protein